MADYKEREIDVQSLKSGRSSEVETGLITKEAAKVPPEVRRWIEEIEKDPVMQTGTFDNNGQVVPAGMSSTQVQLPVGKGAFAEGFKKGISDAGRWLSVFLLRIIKKESGNVKFKEE